MMVTPISFIVIGDVLTKGSSARRKKLSAWVVEKQSPVHQVFDLRTVSSLVACILCVWILSNY
jgi:hypothetical protein